MSVEVPAELQRQWRDAIHAAGMRVTPQREALLAAVWRLRHATAETLVAELAGTDESVNMSTIYRGLDALQRIGLVRHAHLGSGSPTYHIAVESAHLHLQCNSCGRVLSLEAGFGDDFAERIAARTGFVADLTHGAVYGVCADCFAASASARDDGV